MHAWLKSPNFRYVLRSTNQYSIKINYSVVQPIENLSLEQY